MPSKRKKIKLICPCCNIMRGGQAQQYLLDMELECNRHRVKIGWLHEEWSVRTAMT